MSRRPPIGAHPTDASFIGWKTIHVTGGGELMMKNMFMASAVGAEDGAMVGPRWLPLWWRWRR